MICPICQSETVLYLLKNHCDLHYCKQCGLVFVAPIPAELATIYQENYFHIQDKIKEFGYADYETDKEAMKHVFDYYLRLIEAGINKGKIFDVGAATGYFLNLARARGWQTAGIEISVYAAGRAQERGHLVRVGKLTEVEITERFDAVTLWDVFEHLDDPQNYLKAINKILDLGGILALNTIDRGSWWARFWGKKWHLIIPPEHLFYYSRKNLEKILIDNGFAAVKIKKIGKKFSAPGIFKMLYFWLGWSVWKQCYVFCLNNHFLSNLFIPINLRDNIFILARKIKNL